MTGAQLRVLRRWLGSLSPKKMSQEEMAEKIGVTQKTISVYENDHKPIPRLFKNAVIGMVERERRRRERLGHPIPAWLPDLLAAMEREKGQPGQ